MAWLGGGDSAILVIEIRRSLMPVGPAIHSLAHVRGANVDIGHQWPKHLAASSISARKEGNGAPPLILSPPDE